MSSRLYVYEVPDQMPPAYLHTVTSANPRLWHQGRLAVAVTEWAGLPTRWKVEEVPFVPLPGGQALFYTYADLDKGSIVVSTVPLPWLPESTRRGVFSQTQGRGAR